MVLSLHKQPFVTAHFQFITAHFVRHCALKNALWYTRVTDGQTDGRAVAYRLYAMLSRAKNLDYAFRVNQDCKSLQQIELS